MMDASKLGSSLGLLICFYFDLFFTDDWQFKREAYSYFVGERIHFEVSAVIRNHMPLRVYVDHCVATATPDAEAPLRYDFIENFGWVPQTNVQL